MKKRKLIIDALRGFAVLNMILYHGLYDVVYLFNRNIDWYTARPGYLWQQSIAMTFILVSGFTRHLSKQSLKDGIIIFLWGLALSIITALFIPEQLIIFGILSFLGMSILMTWFFDKSLRKIPPILGVILSLAAFILLKNISGGSIFFGKITLPIELYQYPPLFFLGFPDKRFFSTDYYPLLPWFFLFLTGYYMGMAYEKKYFSLPNSPKKENALTWIGQNSLTLYLIHQPILYIMLTGIFTLLKK